MMRNLTKIAIFCLLSVLFTVNAVVAQTSQAPTMKKEGEISYLFIDVADRGTLQKNQDKDTYTLTLYNIDAWVTYFSDVPNRITGMMSVSKFSKLMQQTTAKVYTNGLNAGIVAIDSSNNKKIRYIVSISNPNYKVKEGTVTFTARPLSDDKSSLPDSSKFEHVSVFVDNVCISCGGHF